MKRCDWANTSSLEIHYHDEEWGVPIHDDRMLFEMLILEGAQSGLSWLTILKKREGYLKAFDNFDVNKIALYGTKKVEILRHNAEIVRNKMKINACIENAKRFLEIQQEYGSFDRYIWSFVGGKAINNQWTCIEDVPSMSEVSKKMSIGLKEKGLKFVGPTICYAYMQAVGMVNDHITSCFRYKETQEIS
ncbi:DNA-3-methyladenine glycosylase I [Psychromonas sp. CNPT3]|uniref:DNA-3-methyladenine glycosylase I n=1 Tax=Psychromonas sp. CNPT3 TaxID=314282 RepID=UPI0002C1006A|nr:DNA-3-methyladenine glycosylase I [Psychromonas sp. CNPT3]AGH81055.1 DNA-3-methyladenine glycosylase I [Psychromonas sp. CNPT3]